MDQQTSKQVEARLRENWTQLYRQILDAFPTVARVDIDSARTESDLVRVIADKSRFSERLVETKILELVGVGASTSTQQRPQFGSERHGGDGGEMSSRHQSSIGAMA